MFCVGGQRFVFLNDTLTLMTDESDFHSFECARRRAHTNRHAVRTGTAFSPLHEIFSPLPIAHLNIFFALIICENIFASHDVGG
jgi:hypothetical protein